MHPYTSYGRHAWFHLHGTGRPDRSASEDTKYKMKNSLSTVGLEPSTRRFQVWCSADWASRAWWMLSIQMALLHTCTPNTNVYLLEVYLLKIIDNDYIFRLILTHCFPSGTRIHANRVSDYSLIADNAFTRVVQACTLKMHMVASIYRKGSCSQYTVCVSLAWWLKVHTGRITISYGHTK